MPLELDEIRNRDGEWIQIRDTYFVRSEYLAVRPLRTSDIIDVFTLTRWQRFSAWMRWFWLEKQWT